MTQVANYAAKLERALQGGVYSFKVRYSKAQTTARLLYRQQ